MTKAVHEISITIAQSASGKLSLQNQVLVEFLSFLLFFVNKKV